MLLNTYYCAMPTLRPPEAILLFSTPLLRNVARVVSKAFHNWLFRKMYWWQVGRFMREASDGEEFLPLLYQQFAATPSAQPAWIDETQTERMERRRFRLTGTVEWKAQNTV